MAAKRGARTQIRKLKGPRGPRGPIGPTGPRGPAGPNYASEMGALARQVDELAKALRVQVQRIAQIQLQLDRLATGQSPGPERRKFPRTTN